MTVFRVFLLYEMFYEEFVLGATTTSLKMLVFLEHPVVRQLHLGAASSVAGKTKTVCNGSGGKSTRKTHLMAKKNTSRLGHNCHV